MGTSVDLLLSKAGRSPLSLSSHQHHVQPEAVQLCEGQPYDERWISTLHEIIRPHDAGYTG